MSDDVINSVKLKAMEQTVFRNMKTTLDDNKDTREKVNELVELVNTLNGNQITLRGEVAELRRQLGLLQQQFYAKGTTSYGDNSELGNKGSERPTE